MGLDVTAYSKLKLIGNATDTEDYEEKFDWRATFYAWPGYASGDYFPDHAEGIEAGGVYEYEDSHGFRAGSYSSYSWWREKLSLLALGVTPKEVWSEPSQFKEKPFYWLIDFSDCEGLISGEPAKKLLTDFEAYQEAADEHPEKMFRQKYAKWRKAFELAVDGGVVYFH